MPHIIYIFVLLFSCSTLLSQKNQIQFLKEYNIHNSLSEISGITSINQGKTFWTHNDGGDDAVLYEIDSLANILKKVKILSAKNVDWEDIIFDGNKSIYIGDIGNNKKNRDSILIYKININDLSSHSEINATTYNIYLKSKETRQDFEAMIYKNDTLFLFSKNWTKKLSYHTIVFAFPLSDQFQDLHKIKILKAKNHFLPESQVTSAAYDPVSDKAYLLSSTSIAFFNLADIYRSQKTKLKFLKLKYLGQHEALYYYNNHFIIGQEKNNMMNSTQAIQYYQINTKKNLR